MKPIQNMAAYTPSPATLKLHSDLAEYKKKIERLQALYPQEGIVLHL